MADVLYTYSEARSILCDTITQSACCIFEVHQDSGRQCSTCLTSEKLRVARTLFERSSRTSLLEDGGLELLLLSLSCLQHTQSEIFQAYLAIWECEVRSLPWTQLYRERADSMEPEIAQSVANNPNEDRSSIESTRNQPRPQQQNEEHNTDGSSHDQSTSGRTQRSSRIIDQGEDTSEPVRQRPITRRVQYREISGAQEIHSQNERQRVPTCMLQPLRGRRLASVRASFMPWTQLKIVELAQKIIRTPLPSAQLSAPCGFVYVFKYAAQESDAQGRIMLKIGETRRDPTERKAEIERRCNCGPLDLIHIADQRPVRFYIRAEELIHSLLANYMREVWCCTSHRLRNSANGHENCVEIRHREWFHMEEDKAIKTVKIWLTFVSQIYDEDGFLVAGWSPLLNNAAREHVLGLGNTAIGTIEPAVFAQTENLSRL